MRYSIMLSTTSDSGLSESVRLDLSLVDFIKYCVFNTLNTQLLIYFMNLYLLNQGLDSSSIVDKSINLWIT